MSDADNTNELLREIRDILAAEAAKREDYLNRMQSQYELQITKAADEIRKRARLHVLWIVVLIVLLTMLVRFT